MFLIDDFLLAVIIACIVLLATMLTSSIMCFLGLLVGCGSSFIRGGAKSSGKKSSGKKKDKPQSCNKTYRKKEIKDYIDKFGNKIDIMLKEYKDRNIIYDITDEKNNNYKFVKFSDERKKQVDHYLNRAKEIYKNEGGDVSVFDIDESFYSGSLDPNDYSSEACTISDKIVNKLIGKRILDDEYDELNKFSIAHYDIHNITFHPLNEDEFKKKIDKIYDYSIIESVRELNDSELKELNGIISDFNAGKLTKPENTINFYDGTSKNVASCNVKCLNKRCSDTYKKLHWGQRKLLLSEIDFFNRVALDIGDKKFKEEKMSLVYPGSAHGHHLLIEMEMYPNLILYLWDPAKYIKILFIIEFNRRNLPITFSYTDGEMAEAEKYKGRVFINMELTDKEFIQYHTNATTDNIEENYKTKYGFFTKKSADFYLKYRKEQKDTSITLFCSDIRLFTNMTAAVFFRSNLMKDISDLPSIRVAHEHGRHANYIRDMNLQKDWYDFVKAEYGVFKFKLKTNIFTKSPIQYEYLDGDIILQTWAPTTSTETRLYTSPHNKKDPKDRESANKMAFYNVVKYTDKLKTFNKYIRTHNMGNIKLSSVGINLKSSPNSTLNDVWKHCLPYDLIGMDALLETYILYDYLCIFKDNDKITQNDLILIISDITQTCLEPGNVNGIRGYLDDNADIDSILESRSEFHKGFRMRLDYHSPRTDRAMCTIKYPDDHRKKYR